MKRSSIFGMLLLVVLSGGCNNTYTVKTKINPDGSFEKTIVCEGDSLGIYKLPLPFVFKDGWKIDTRKETDKQTKFITTAQKTYASIEELQAEAARGSDSAKLAIVSRIEKRFRWFFTYYTYEEKIPAFGRFRQHVPFTSAFTPDEIERLGTGKDTVVNKRFDAYWTRNIADELIDELIAASRQLNDPALAPERWEEKRNMIGESMVKEDMSKASVLVAFLEKTFGTTSVRNMTGVIDRLLTELIVKAQNENELDVA